MALIKETGGIVENANTYVTRAEAVTYFTDRNNALWIALAGSVQDAMLLRAAEFLDRSYAWRGEIASDAQAMRWPRKCVKDRDGREIAADAIPTQIAAAQCELALLLATGSGVGGSAGSVSAGLLSRVKAGSVEVAWQSGGGVAPSPSSNVLPNGAGEYLDRILHGLFAAPSRTMVSLGKS